MADDTKLTSPIRASGPALWLHAGEASHVSALNYLSYRLLQMDSNAIIVITSQPSGVLPLREETGIYHVKVPDESVTSVQDFLNFWGPHTLIWTGGNLRPTILRMAANSGVKMILANCKATDFKSKGLRLLPDVTRKILRLFSEFYAVDDMAANQLNRMGVAPNRIKLKGALQSAAIMPDAPQALTTEPLSTFTGRTLWLAAWVSLNEAKVALEAHQLVMQRDHRSLLLLLPRESIDRQTFLQAAEAAGLRVACRSEGVLPDTLTQVYVADPCYSLSACYRLSPVAFLGQSMDEGVKGIDPFVPAAFGCALLHGPNVSFYEERYSRLTKDGGAQIIRNAATLAQAVSQLSNPAQSARMALAAWETISEGAEVTDALIDIALAHCDSIGPQ